MALLPGLRKNAEFDTGAPCTAGDKPDSARAWLMQKQVINGETPLDKIFAGEGFKTPSKLIRKIDEHKMADDLPQEMLRQGRTREREALEYIFEKTALLSGRPAGAVCYGDYHGAGRRMDSFLGYPPD